MITITFILSGTIIAILLVAKRVEEKKNKSVLILNLISKGDEHARTVHHDVLRYYSLGKEKVTFLVSKQLPRYSRSSINKVMARVEERLDKHFHNIRDSRLLKKSESISDFFKTMSEVEKGEGELHEDVYDEITQEITTPKPELKKQSIEVKFEIAEPVVSSLSYENTEEPAQNVMDIAKPKTKRTRKPSTKRKLKVTSQETEQFI